MTRLVPLVLLCVCMSACLPRQRFNKNCDWTGDSSFPLDLSNPRDQKHLVEDGRLAEELAMRYSDFRHKELSGYEGHGGLLEHGKVTRGCMEKLFGEIERSHGVTRQQVDEAREHRDWRFDLAVVLSFAALYSVATMWVCRLLARRFGETERAAWVVAALLTSVVMSLAAVQVLGLWSETAEMIRVGNDHLGASRSARSPWSPWGPHLGKVSVGGIVVFWLIAWLRRPATSADGQGL